MLKIFKFLIYGLIQLIELIEYRKLDIDENDISKKIMNTIELDDTEVWTDTGWHTASHIHTVQPYKVWRLRTSSGKYLECADNHIVFDQYLNEVLVKDLVKGNFIMTENGPEKIIEVIKTFNKVSMFDLTVDSADHRYYTNGILSHNTITSSIFLTWYLLFHFDKNVLLMSNKGATTKEIMDKIKAIVEGLPFFLKPGIVKKDVMSMMFDNKCRLIGQNTTKTGGIGFTIHLLFLDEFAHIQESIKRTFYENVYPTLSSSKISRVIITSTPNGYDLFHDLYVGAVNKINEYAAIRVDWWEVPGRDENWKQREIANLGSEEAFNQQYGCQFLASSSLLLSADDLVRMKRNEREFEFREVDPLDDLCIDYSGLKWDPDFDIDEIENEQNFYVISIDISEGVGRDYTIFNIFKVNPISLQDAKKITSPSSISDFFSLEQVGIFRSNLLNIDDCSKVLYGLVVNLFNQENLRLIIEYNTYGSHLIKNLITLYPSSNDFDEESIVRYYHRVGAKTKTPGLRIQKDSKKLYCEKTKRLVTNHRIIIKETKSIREAELYSRNPNGSYSAQTGHDDIMATIVNCSSFFDTLDYIEIVEEMFDNIDASLQIEIDGLLDGNSDGEETIYDFL
jgi:hypothetical protein